MQLLWRVGSPTVTDMVPFTSIVRHISTSFSHTQPSMPSTWPYFVQQNNTCSGSTVNSILLHLSAKKPRFVSNVFNVLAHLWCQDWVVVSCKTGRDTQFAMQRWTSGDLAYIFSGMLQRNRLKIKCFYENSGRIYTGWSLHKLTCKSSERSGNFKLTAA